jgi:thiol-disulfide isomerase/thioredoxin
MDGYSITLKLARSVVLASSLAACATSGRVAATPVAIGPDADRVDVSSVVGKPASDWGAKTWVNSSPRRLEDLRGSVVLVRWFMTEECPYCSATAPTLVALDAKYASRGLAVIGMYHHKSDGPLVVENVRKLVTDTWHFRFPVAIDDDWKTLKAWWLDAHPDSWTSVSFILDKRGVKRFVHLGGAYAPGSADHRQIEAWIEQLLSEP